MRLTVQQAFLVSLLASSQLALCFQPEVEAREVDERHVGSGSTLASRWVQLTAPIEARHHTEAQIAAKKAAAEKKGKKPKREALPQEADEFGPWDSTEDEFGSWVDKRSPHHTEAQIAAKNAAAKNKNGNPKRDEILDEDDEADEEKSFEKREPHHTETQIAAKKAAAKKKADKNPKRDALPQEADKFGPWDSIEDEFGTWLDKRDPHHTEAQIAAKKAAEKKTGGKKPKREELTENIEEEEEESGMEKREAHHTEAQIAAKKAAAEKKGGKKPKREEAVEDVEDVEEDVDDEDESEIEKRAAEKKGKKGKKGGKKGKKGGKKADKKPKREASPQEADEFGPWDSTVDEFGSWVDKREAHHTEAQIAAKKAASKKNEGKP